MESNKYMIFDIQPSVPGNSVPINEVKRYLQSLNAVHYIYPTHDDKAYAVFKYNDYSAIESLFSNGKEITPSKVFKMKQHFLDSSDRFNEYGLFKLKSDLLPNSMDLSQKAKFFQQYFGLTLKTVIDDQVEINLLGDVNYYQYDLLNFWFENRENGINEKTEIKSPLSNNKSNLSPYNTASNNHSPLEYTPYQTKTPSSSKQSQLFTVLSSSNKKLSFHFKALNVRFEIKRGDLLDEKVEAIVNPANQRLRLGGGVAGAIENRCGNQVQKDCDEYLRRLGIQSIAVSQVTHTKAYNISAKHILHACGPCWHDYKTNEKQTCYSDLKNTFFNVLIYLETKLTGVESVAMPLISSGIYSVPKEMCCRALYEAIEEYNKETEEKKRSLKTVVFINLDEETNDYLCEFFNEKIKTDTFSNNNNNSNSKVMMAKKETHTSKSDKNFQNMPEKFVLNKCHECGETRGLKKAKCKCYYCSDCYQNYEQAGEKCYVCS